MDSYSILLLEASRRETNMSFKLSKSKEGFIYFVTAKICGGKYIFLRPQYASIILNSLKWLRENKKIRLYAFVIMPNHIHFLARALDNFTILEICRCFESFTAHEILKLLVKEDKKYLIDFFKKEAEGLKDRVHKIWQDIQAKECSREDFVLQKFKYIHNNPINKGWELVKDRMEYKYSSSIFYDSNFERKSIIEVDNLFDYL